jgi:hypothetical protein
MIVQALLKELQDQQVQLTVVGDKLKVHAPKRVITQEICMPLAEHKVELMALLSGMTSNYEEIASDKCPLAISDTEQRQWPSHDASHDLSPLASALNGDNQEEPEIEWSKEELALLEELDGLLEDNSMAFDGEVPWQGIDDPFPADLWLDTTPCCGQPPSETIDDLLALLEPELSIQPWSVCSHCGAEACYYDGHGEGFCGNDCYRAYHQQYQASPEQTCVTQEASFGQDIAPIGEQCPQAARKTSRGFFCLHEIAKGYQLYVTKLQRDWFVGLSTRSRQWTIPFPDTMVQDINVPHRLARRHWPHLCRPPNL